MPDTFRPKSYFPHGSLIDHQRRAFECNARPRPRGTARRELSVFLAQEVPGLGPRAVTRCRRLLLRNKGIVVSRFLLGLAFHE